MTPQNNRKDQEEEHVIVVKDDAIYGYVDVIDKIMHRKTPYIKILLRRKAFEPGVYRIKNGQTNRLTQDEIKVLNIEPVMWISLTNEQCKEILGIDNDEKLLKDYGTYLRVLRKYFSRHDMSYQNQPIMYLHHIEHINKPKQEKLF